jgi:opacity protein-like surface antigen
LAFALLIVATSAAAQELNTELTVFGGYRFGGTFDVLDSDVTYEIQDSSSFGLIWNHRHQANTQWEVFFSQQKTEVELSEPTIADELVDVELYTLQLGGTYLWEGDAVRPYLVMTIGGTHIKSDPDNGESDSDTFFSGSIGVGFKMQPSKRLGLRLEARLNGVLMRDSTKLFCQTGPDVNVCAVEIEGSMLGQLEMFAGIVFRF